MAISPRLLLLINIQLRPKK